MKKILNKYYKKIIIAIILLFLVYIIFTTISIYYYLNTYGYSIKELPKTVAVYFHFSKGFTVNQNENGESVFIGRHDYIYEDVFNKKGYYEYDRMGNEGIYAKKGEEERTKIYITSGRKLVSLV